MQFVADEEEIFPPAAGILRPETGAPHPAANRPLRVKTLFLSRIVEAKGGIFDAGDNGR